MGNRLKYLIRGDTFPKLGEKRDQRKSLRKKPPLVGMKKESFEGSIPKSC